MLVLLSFFIAATMVLYFQTNKSPRYKWLYYAVGTITLLLITYALLLAFVFNGIRG